MEMLTFFFKKFLKTNLDVTSLFGQLTSQCNCFVFWYVIQALIYEMYFAFSTKHRQNIFCPFCICEWTINLPFLQLSQGILQYMHPFDILKFTLNLMYLYHILPSINAALILPHPYQRYLELYYILNISTCYSYCLGRTIKCYKIIENVVINVAW